MILCGSKSCCCATATEQTNGDWVIEDDYNGMVILTKDEITHLYKNSQ